MRSKTGKYLPNKPLIVLYPQVLSSSPSIYSGQKKGGLRGRENPLYILPPPILEYGGVQKVIPNPLDLQKPSKLHPHYPIIEFNT